MDEQDRKPPVTYFQVDAERRIDQDYAIYNRKWQSLRWPPQYRINWPTHPNKFTVDPLLADGELVRMIALRSDEPSGGSRFVVNALKEIDGEFKVKRLFEHHFDDADIDIEQGGRITEDQVISNQRRLMRPALVCRVIEKVPWLEDWMNFVWAQNRSRPSPMT